VRKATEVEKRKRKMSNKTILGGVGGEGEPTLEELRRRFEEQKAKLFSTSKSRAIAVAVDAQTAENAKARPESIRIATRDESGTTRVVGPRRFAVDTGGSSAVGWMGWGHSSALGTGRAWFDRQDDGAQVQHRYNLH
jgi:hypothetical protein